ncbi:MAG: serine/threonine protein kinase [Deltaproteobacteria bacterium]|nr:MAG: serine/threonine protein kinase [Deltaproteobacteria bacterium]
MNHPFKESAVSQPLTIGGNSVLEGRWRIDQFLGAGAFGRVYSARDLKSGQRVAIKAFDRATSEAGYLSELAMLFAEEHPNVVPTRSFGYLAGQKYIVYDFIPGGTLRECLVREKRLSGTVSLSVAADIVEALAFAHERRIVHNDLKPENLLLSTANWPFRVMVCDFGLAARLQDAPSAATNMGSPAYMAPEQFGDRQDHRADYYALGVILYECLFGRRPFAGDPIALRHAHRNIEPTFPSRAPRALLDLLRGLLAKNPEERFDTPDRLREAIARAMDNTKSQRTAHVPAPEYISAPEPIPLFTLRLRHAPIGLVPACPRSLLLHFPNQVARLTQDGHPLSLFRAPASTEDHFPSHSASEAHAWIHGGQLIWWREDQVRSFPVPAAATGFSRVALHPVQDLVAIVSTDAVRLLLGDGTVSVHADFASYGSPPPIAFSNDGQVLFLATEAPRTQLVAMTLDGNVIARTPADAGDPILCPIGSDHMIIGGAGRGTLHCFGPDGFLVQRHDSHARIHDIQPAGRDRVAILGSSKIEVLRWEPPDAQTHPSMAFGHLLSRPPDGGQLLLSDDTLYSVLRQGDAATIRAFQLPDSLQGDPQP